MVDGQIPINPGDLPIDSPALEESGVYRVELKKFAINPKTDKNGNVFGSIQVEVLEGDFEGATLMHNYIPLPTSELLAMLHGSKGEQFKAKSLLSTFGRLCKAFKIESPLPAITKGDAASYAAFQESFDRHLGRDGRVTIRNQEYPEGSGRLRSGINDFVL